MAEEEPTVSLSDPGAYAEDARLARIATQAVGGVCLVVFEGKYGSGFDAQLRIENLRALPDKLRAIADIVEKHVAAIDKQLGSED